MSGITSGPLFAAALLSFCVVVVLVGATLEALLTRRASRTAGTRRDGGYAKRSASTSMRARGTRTPETATTVDFSFSSPRLGVSASPLVPILRLPASSSTGLGLSTDATATRGANGAPLERAV